MENGDHCAPQEAPLRPITLEEELRKNPQLKEQDVALLRDWVSMQLHLPPVHDRELVLLLHLSNYSVEAAKSLTDTLMTGRTHLIEFFADRDPTLNDNLVAARRSLFTILPKTTPEGYKIIFHRTINSDASHIQLSHTLKLFLMIIDLWVLSEGTCPGIVYVFDMTGITMAHLAAINVAVMKKFFSLQDSYFRIVKRIHLINIVPFTDTLLSIIKLFMKKEFCDLLHAHKDISHFYEYVPQDVLPEELGGSAPSVMKLHERMQSQLLANREYFMTQEQRLVDELQRIESPRTKQDLFGAEGTFRKLDID